MKIKITKGKHWYSDKVGEIFEVTGTIDSDGDYRLSDGAADELRKLIGDNDRVSGYFVKTKDCEVVPDDQRFYTVTQYENGDTILELNNGRFKGTKWKLWNPPTSKFTKGTFVVDADGNYGRIVDLWYGENQWEYLLSDNAANEYAWVRAEGDIGVA